MSKGIKLMAASATIHCLIGCAIGEMIGVTIGTHFGWNPIATVVLAFVLSFISGYSVSTIPLVRSGLRFWEALRLVFIADTLSILAMTLADNIIMLSVPGAMDKNLLHPIYWMSRLGALTAAFIVAYPVNLYLIKKGKGHALTHHFHHGKHHTMAGEDTGQHHAHHDGHDGHYHTPYGC